MNNVSFYDKIKALGIAETMYKSVSYLLLIMASFIRVFFLQIRGYNFHSSVIIRAGVRITQSRLHSISIAPGSTIGTGVRLIAGFSGKISIGKNVLIDDYSYISSQQRISIGDDSMIAANCYIVDFNHVLPLSSSKKNLTSPAAYVRDEIIIGKFVWIGANVVILKGVNVGDGAVIGAGSIVTKDVPEKSVVVCNPARVIRKLNS
jgi:serine acetyltransferase